MPLIFATSIPEQDMPSAAQAFFCFVFFVATKKMKLLSGNPDGFAFILGLQSDCKVQQKEQQIDNLLPPLQLQLLTQS
jgi:hypothetical protein